MSYRIPLPPGGRRSTLDLIEPNSTAVQRYIRRHGLGNYEPSTVATVLALGERHDPGLVFFDIGANMGLYGSLTASMFAPAAVHCFEPAPLTAKVASDIARRNRLPVKVHQVALSDQDGEAELFLSPVSDASNSLVAGFRDTDRSVTVPTLRVDSFVAEHGIDPHLLKLDVETHERAVLDGARATIERARPSVVIEVLRRKGRDHGLEIQEFFDGLGYSYYELSADPTWEAQSDIRGSGTTDRDWLLAPSPLDDDFADRWSHWSGELARCDSSTNPRPPVVASVRAARRRGGWSEVVATASRYVRSVSRST